jgi:WD40 repeat protein
MVGVRGYQALSLALLLVLQVSGTVVAIAGEAGLYDQPVLTLDPGMHTARINRVDVSATGVYAVSGSYDKTVRIWEVQMGRLLRTIRLPQGPGHVGRVYAVAISPNGVLVAASGYTGAVDYQPVQIYLFQRDTGALIRRLEGLPEAVTYLVFSPTGRYLAATLGGTHGLRVYDRDADWQEVARDDAYGDSSYGAAFAADGRLATTSFDGALRLYDRAFQRVAMARLATTNWDGTQTTVGTRPFGLAFTPTGDRLAIGYAGKKAVSLVDGHALTPLPGPDIRGIDNGHLTSVAWSADGTTLYAGGSYWRAGTTHVVAWAEAGGGPRRELAGGAYGIMSLRPLPDGGVLVGASDPWLGVVDTGTPRWVQRPQHADLRDQGRAFRVSADGGIVDFGYEYEGKVPARFDLARLALFLDPPADGRTRPPEKVTLNIRPSPKDFSRPTPCRWR